MPTLGATVAGSRLHFLIQERDPTASRTRPRSHSREIRASLATSGSRSRWTSNERPLLSDRLPPRSCIRGRQRPRSGCCLRCNSGAPGGHVPHPRSAPPSCTQASGAEFRRETLAPDEATVVRAAPELAALRGRAGVSPNHIRDLASPTTYRAMKAPSERRERRSSVRSTIARIVSEPCSKARTTGARAPVPPLDLSESLGHAH